MRDLVFLMLLALGIACAACDGAQQTADPKPTEVPTSHPGRLDEPLECGAAKEPNRSAAVHNAKRSAKRVAFEQIMTTKVQYGGIRDKAELLLSSLVPCGSDGPHGKPNRPHVVRFRGIGDSHCSVCLSCEPDWEPKQRDIYQIRMSLAQLVRQYAPGPHERMNARIKRVDEYAPAVLELALASALDTPLYREPGVLEERAIQQLTSHVPLLLEQPVFGAPLVTWYSQVDERFLAYARVYRLMRDDIGVGKVVELYDQTEAADSDLKRYLDMYHRFVEEHDVARRAQTTELATQDPVTSTAFYAVGFWMRRMHDGTHDEIWEAMGKVLARVDPEAHTRHFRCPKPSE